MVIEVKKRSPYSYSKIIIYAIAALLIIIAISLAWWQFQRGINKEYIKARESAKQQVKQEQIPNIVDKSIDLTEVSLSPIKSSKKHIFIDNKTRGKQIGLEVIKPVLLSSGWLLVNLGWVKWQRGDSLPVIKSYKGEKIAGVLRAWPKKGFTLEAKDGGKSIKKPLLWLDYDLIKNSLKGNLLPYIVYIDPYSPMSFNTSWSFIGSTPIIKHYAYAVQWLMLALLILILVIVYSGAWKKLIKTKT